VKVIKAIIKEIKQETPTVKRIKIETEKKINFIPGQFLNLIVEQPEKIIRPYSIASTPDEKDIEFIIRSTPEGKMTNHLETHLKEGDKIQLMGPFGQFKLKKAKSYLFLGGGSGIAPLISMIRSLKKNYKLIYSEKTQNEIICHDELKNSIITLTKESWNKSTGRINKSLIKKNLNEDSLIYICGSPDFVKQMKLLLSELKVAPERINTEIY